MEKSITITIVTRKTDEQISNLRQNIEDTCGVEYELRIVFNENNESLTSVYNKSLSSSSTDINVFCHDDIEFKNKGWGLNLVELFSSHQDYGIIGVAGSKQFDSNAAWWNYSKKGGQVMHKADGRTWLTCFSPIDGDDFMEVCMIDGLFMSLSKSRVSSQFDEDFQGFDHYDTSFCLKNYVDGQTKIGVTTKIRLCHASIGELSPTWYTNRELLNKKYNEYYPIEVK